MNAHPFNLDRGTALVEHRGALLDVAGREGEPWFMLAFRNGSVLVTNAPPPPSSVKLFRMRGRDQAEAAAAIVEQEARLATDGETWLVPDLGGIETRAGTLSVLAAWADRLEPLLADRLQGPGWYRLSDSRFGRGM